MVFYSQAGFFHLAQIEADLKRILYWFSDKFLPFKTMLDSKYDDQIPEECRFDVDMLFLSAKAKKVRHYQTRGLRNGTYVYQMRSKNTLIISQSDSKESVQSMEQAWHKFKVQ